MQPCNQTGIVSCAVKNYSFQAVNVKSLDGNEVQLTKSQILQKRLNSEQNAATDFNISVEDFRLACTMFDIKIWDFATVRPEDYSFYDEQALKALSAYVSNKDEGPNPKKQRRCEAGKGSAARPSPVSAASTVSCSPVNAGSHILCNPVPPVSSHSHLDHDIVDDLTKLLDDTTSNSIDNRPIHEMLFQGDE